MQQKFKLSEMEVLDTRMNELRKIALSRVYNGYNLAK